MPIHGPDKHGGVSGIGVVDGAISGATSFIAQSSDPNKGLSVNVPDIDPSWGLLGRQRRIGLLLSLQLIYLEFNMVLLISGFVFLSPVLGQGQVPADGELGF